MCLKFFFFVIKKCFLKLIEIDFFLVYVVYYVRMFFECLINKFFFNVVGNIVYFFRLWFKVKYSILCFII